MPDSSENCSNGESAAWTSDGRPAEYRAQEEGGRTYGEGIQARDQRPRPEYSPTSRLTGVSSRAKQFVPFAALCGFYEMIEEAKEDAS